MDTGICLSSPSLSQVRKIIYLLAFVSMGGMIRDDNGWQGAAGNAKVDEILKNQTIPAVLVFGDSIVDPGNNNDRLTPAKCNYPPYGKDFQGGKATGRFSNGLLPGDFLAIELRVKTLLPAYRDPNLKPEDLISGVSFASGGAGYDPLTSQSAAALSLEDQLDMLRNYIAQVTALVGEERTSTILSKGLFVVCFGSNDIANTYFSSPLRQPHYSVPSYTTLMADSATVFLQKLYGLGARRIGVFGAPPLGCVPSQRTLAGGIQRDCADDRNQASLLFNSKLSSVISDLKLQFPDSKFVFVDIYTPLLEVIQDAPKYGFEVANKGCCGTGLVEVTALCNHLTPTCPDDTKYVFWDSFHPTQAAYTIIVQKILDKYASDFV